MANFSPSISFAKHWLSTPLAARTAIYDELNDIIALLDSSEPVQQFKFRRPDFYQAVAEAMQSVDSTASTGRLIHSIETTSLKADNPSASLPNLQELETRLNQSLSEQIEEFLGEHMSQLSEDLRAWVKIAIRHELAALDTSLDKS